MDRADELRAAWAGVSAAFAALGRVFLCLDREFRVLHASRSLDELLGSGAARSAEGRPVEELLGSIEVTTEPEGARVLVNGEERGVKILERKVLTDDEPVTWWPNFFGELAVRASAGEGIEEGLRFSVNMEGSFRAWRRETPNSP